MAAVLVVGPGAETGVEPGSAGWSSGATVLGDSCTGGNAGASGGAGGAGAGAGVGAGAFTRLRARGAWVQARARFASASVRLLMRGRLMTNVATPAPAAPPISSSKDAAAHTRQ